MSILITRPAGRGEKLAAELEKHGLNAVHSPFVEFEYETDTDIRNAVRELARGDFDWLLLTSVTTVHALTALDEWELLKDAQPFRAAAVGHVTAEAAREAGLAVETIAKGSAASLISVFPKLDESALPGPRILYPVSAAAESTLEQALGFAGYRVQRETAYRPRSVSQSREVVDNLAYGGYEAVVLTSPMIARALAQLSIHVDTKIVVIGEPTRDAALEAGLPVHRVAEEPNDVALAQAVAEVVGV